MSFSHDAFGQVGVGSKIFHVSVFVTKTSDLFKAIKKQEENLWMVKLSLFRQFLCKSFFATLLTS